MQKELYGQHPSADLACGLPLTFNAAHDGIAEGVQHQDGPSAGPLPCVCAYHARNVPCKHAFVHTMHENTLDTHVEHSGFLCSHQAAYTSDMPD
eukprot:182097-Chlamydomonas_euryale.AAC.2